jgi:DNA-binding GntR family transcriptional regulator
MSSTEIVYSRLREMMLSGEISPSTVLSQVRLAQSLGVSVTPVREAMRLLQAEGYLTAEHNRRTRVAPVDPREVDSVYACRIVAEGLATRLTVPAVSDAYLADLRNCFQLLRAAARARDVRAWEAWHRELHLRLAAGSGQAMAAVIRPMADRCERYRRTTHPGRDAEAWFREVGEHAAIVGAYEARDTERAAALLASHLARSALNVLDQIAPELDPVAIRAALTQMRRDPAGR